MTTAEARTSIKRKFKITGSTLDTDIDEAVATAVDLLAPFIKKPIIDTYNVASGSDTQYLEPVLLTTDADLIAVNITGGSTINEPFTDYTRRGNRILLKQWLADDTDVTLFLEVPYTITTIADIPRMYTRPMIELASAEFATTLAGDKSRYNIYSQQTGARGVDNMLDLAEYYETRALQRLQRFSDGGGIS